MYLRYYAFFTFFVSSIFCMSEPLYGFMDSTLPLGVIATVNGQPILLEDVEALHDTTGNILAFQENPEVKFLQEQYSNSLYMLIIYTLMSQDLEKKGYKTTDQDLLKAEEEIKQDYVGEDFEKSLQEEYLDIVTWRKLMKQRITFQKFQKYILRPQITLSHEEVEAYYNEHYDDFLVPEKVEIVWFQEAGNKDIPCQDIRGEGTHNSQYGELVCIDLDRLPEEIKNDLIKIQPGECTPSRKEGEVFQRVFLRHRYPEHQSSILEAYSRIELILLEEKFKKAYNVWLEYAISKAEIKVRPQFQPQKHLPNS